MLAYVACPPPPRFAAPPANLDHGVAVARARTRTDADTAALLMAAAGLLAALPVVAAGLSYLLRSWWCSIRCIDTASPMPSGQLTRLFGVWRSLTLTWDRSRQVAQQQGKYLAKLIKKGVKPGMKVPEGVKPFRYSHKGSLAYVGNDKAVMDVPT